MLNRALQTRACCFRFCFHYYFVCTTCEYIIISVLLASFLLFFLLSFLFLLAFISRENKTFFSLQNHKMESTTISLLSARAMLYSFILLFVIAIPRVSSVTGSDEHRSTFALFCIRIQANSDGNAGLVYHRFDWNIFFNTRFIVGECITTKHIIFYYYRFLLSSSMMCGLIYFLIVLTSLVFS